MQIHDPGLLNKVYESYRKINNASKVISGLCLDNLLECITKRIYQPDIGRANSTLTFLNTAHNDLSKFVYVTYRRTRVEIPLGDWKRYHHESREFLKKDDTIIAASGQLQKQTKEQYPDKTICIDYSQARCVNKELFTELDLMRKNPKNYPRIAILLDRLRLAAVSDPEKVAEIQSKILELEEDSSVENGWIN